MTTLDFVAARTEILYFIRNLDVLTIAQRGVATASATGTFSSDTELVIDVTNVKNVRSVTVASVPLVYGTDYTVDIDYLDTTIKCRIAFTSAQTGAYTIPYDFGADAIFPDFPRPDLKLSSFPRIGLDFTEIPSDWGGWNALLTKMQFTVVCYSKKSEDVISYVQTIRSAIMANYKGFFYLKPIRAIAVGPIIKMPKEEGHDKIVQQNFDFESQFNYETNLQ